MSEGKFCFEKHFKMLHENFLEQNQEILSSYPNYYIIIQKLAIFIEKIMSVDETYDFDKALFNLPLHANAFVLENLKEEYWKEKYE